MFNFRLITLQDGNQIIDNTLKTPYEALSPLALLEYIQVDNNLAYASRMEKRRKVEEAKKHSFRHRLKMVFVGL